MYIGLDIGSVSAKAVLMDEKGSVLEEHYVRTKGQPVETAYAILTDILSRTPPKSIKGMAVTGTGGKLLSRLLGVPFVNEIVAQSKSTGTLHPEVRSIIEIGGEDSKLIEIEPHPEAGLVRVVDFAMNTVCAAGTGSFLDQQAARLGVAIEEEFGAMALKSTNPPHIAGRCSVFAKTDMIHLQQEACPDYDIVAGLCHALARNFQSNIAKGKKFHREIAFQGGVAANKGMRKAFEDELGLKPGELLIPKHFASMGAIGAVMTCQQGAQMKPLGDVLDVIKKYLAEAKPVAKGLEPLSDAGHRLTCECSALPPEGRVRAAVGVDVGSISTNVVVISEDGRVLARRYLMTAGRPLEAVTQGLFEVGQEVADRVEVVAVGTTGSGRYLTGHFIGADVVKNEITSHATGALQVDKEVDTIFEIGGQDSKYISLDHGAIVDFTMNKVCAAGTGSFLEEQAEKLGMKIEEEFGGLALAATCPVALGERCTVFMESDLNHHQQTGAPKKDLVAGLSYSIVYNYLNRVVEDRAIGKRIFFQGGVAANRGVKAAFEKVLGLPVTVPPHHDVIGAIGVALIALAENKGKASRFKGFDLTKRKYEMSAFTCDDCPNMCEVRRVSVTGEKPLHYGSRCGKYDEEKKVSKGAHLPRLFREREQALLQAYPKDKPERPIGRTVGIPQATLFFEFLPFWKAFFTELGFDVVISDDTNRKIIDAGLGSVAAETCFPIKVAHGHVLNLLDKKVDFLFVPSIVNLPRSSDRIVHSYACPYVQALPYLLKAALPLEAMAVRTISPILELERGQKHLERVFAAVAEQMQAPRSRFRSAIRAAFGAQRNFYDTISGRGAEILASLGPEDRALVVISRPYNGCDFRLNLDVPDKLRDLGVQAIPMDFLPLAQEDMAGDYPHMYWKYGEKILAAARIVSRDPRLFAVYITNFGCGPDSFISKFFAKEMGGKPFLTLEVDEHSADVGAITRCEAFLDSLKHAEGRKVKVKKPRAGAMPYFFSKIRRRRVYIPHMDDHGRLLAAAMRANDVEGIAMPMADDESLRLGRKYSTGKECYPCIITTGDMLKKVNSPDFDPSRDSFFMPRSMGPCRFGQYHKFHRMILDELGLERVPLVVLDQGTGFSGSLKNLGPSFRKLGWSGIIFVDILQKLARQTRPYERHREESNALYRKYLDIAETYVEQKKDLLPVAAKALEEFSRIERDQSDHRPIVGIVGEVFVRCNEFANSFTANRIEELGGEVVLPPIEEWISYIAHVRKQDYRLRGQAKQLLAELVSQAVMRREANRILVGFERAIRHFPRESPTAGVLNLASRYIHESVRGEAALSMGRVVEYANEGFDGVVNLIPFNCLPGTIVNALLERYRHDFGDIPVLKLSFDGLQQSSEETRLEAFMYQARQRVEAAGAKKAHENRRQK